MDRVQISEDNFLKFLKGHYEKIVYVLQLSPYEFLVLIHLIDLERMKG